VADVHKTRMTPARIMGPRRLGPLDPVKLGTMVAAQYDEVL
jgi:hypothetical protein